MEVSLLMAMILERQLQRVLGTPFLQMDSAVEKVYFLNEEHFSTKGQATIKDIVMDKLQN